MRTLYKSMLWGLLILSATSASAAQTFASGLAQVALLELFTSEGCSSCPPAERWLAQLRDHPKLWHQVVPVSWHVTYWDKLGWKDVYASKAFTARQYAYANAWHSRSVYTPCFVRNGREWRPGDASPNSNSTAGELQIEWHSDGSCHLAYSTPDANTSRSYTATIVLLGSGITSHVKAGENRGRSLKHEFVALRTVSVPLNTDSPGHFTASVSLPTDDLPTAPRHALAAWVTHSRQLTPLQATGGWLD